MSEITLESQLFEIIKNKELSEDIKLAKFDMLIRLGVDVNAKYRGKSVLAHAKDKKLEKISKMLSDNGAIEERLSDTELKNLNKDLFVFIEMHDLNEVKNSIEKGADVNTIRCGLNKVRETPLGTACSYGYIDIVEELLNNDAEVSYDSEENFISPLYIASAKGHTDIVVELLNRGADVNDRTTIYQLTPLIGAVGDRRKKMVEFLLDNGADIDIGDVDGKTALMEAVEGKSTDIIELLINRGANVIKKDKKGKIALEYTDDEEIRKFFMEKVKGDAENDKFEAAKKLEESILERGYF